jgi:hypothetical protein
MMESKAVNGLYLAMVWKKVCDIGINKEMRGLNDASDNPVYPTVRYHLSPDDTRVWDVCCSCHLAVVRV